MKDNPGYFFISALLRFTESDFKGACDYLEKHI